MARKKGEQVWGEQVANGDPSDLTMDLSEPFFLQRLDRVHCKLSWSYIEVN